MEKREAPKTSIIDALRPKFDMDNPKDIEAWEYACSIDKTNINIMLEDFVVDMLHELKELEEQIATIEKQRLSNLNDKVLRKQCRGILDGLRKERDGLRQTIGSEAYKRMATELSRGTIQSRR